MSFWAPEARCLSSPLPRSSCLPTCGRSTEGEKWPTARFNLICIIVEEEQDDLEPLDTRATVIPVLAYPDVNQAATCLCEAFGFSVSLRVGNHRVQLNVGDGAVIVREMRLNEVNAALATGCSVIIRVEAADAHCNRARERGARITQEPTTHPYGERQYNADDFAGHSWTFSQSVADVHPEEWGGTAEQLIK
jgi:uncharacterized glyoxalase superfamily protein PhnB